MSLREEAGKETRVLLSPHPRTLAARWQGGEGGAAWPRTGARTGVEVKARSPPPPLQLILTIWA